ncbi:MAG TPA: 50S ribosomal protein L4 [Aminivibrio sp.]|jgi:large subunit ribosomal protein L4|uniref:50S ribosomal protein L4 n=1 Tax=Aminivibrio sp. TaxID=1872489 RepID=UPI002B1E97D2|nr:50S ribosomal protein L4 [Aminivibrio sp.]MEA4952566.1 50S ribosomal protein L4 [Aminivibrio sp.]HPF85056.1 50S ribosomal protein L4 [Aminivibrio sp.]
MPTLKLVSFQGEQVGEMQLADEVFGAPVHVPAMHQVVVAQLANRRRGTQSAKTRGEVSGGGKKPWRQKKTGRARHGSTRSPIWTGGGVTHAPKPRDYSQKVNKKVRRLAIRSALSLKVRDELMTVVQSFDLSKPSTKEMIAFFSAVNARKPLIVLPESNDTVAKSARNVPGAKVINMGNINVYDLLNAGTLVMTPEVVSRLEEVYVG